MRKIRVLCYHRVLNITNDYNSINVTPENFEKQMEFLSNNYDVIRLEDICKEIGRDGRDGRDAVAISFDDGYKDVLYNVLPILEKYKVPMTVFITTGNIGSEKENWMDDIIRGILEPKRTRNYFELEDEFISGKWSTKTPEERLALYRIINRVCRYSNATKREQYIAKIREWAGWELEGRADRRVMNEQELQLLAGNELVTIGAHTVTHPSLKWMCADEQEEEIASSINTLQKLLGKNMDMFAYPFGSRNDYSEETKRQLEKHGIKLAFTTQPGEIDASMDRLEIPRYPVPDYDAAEFEKFMNAIFGNEVVSEVEVSGSNLNSCIKYIGKIDADKNSLKEEAKLLIWGCGVYGKRIYNELVRLELSDRVVAFADNDPKKRGSTYLGVEVIDRECAINLCLNERITVLISGNYDWEICMDLYKEGVKNLHLYTW